MPIRGGVAHSDLRRADVGGGAEGVEPVVGVTFEFEDIDLWGPGLRAGEPEGGPGATGGGGFEFAAHFPVGELGADGDGGFGVDGAGVIPDCGLGVGGRLDEALVNNLST